MNLNINREEHEDEAHQIDFNALFESTGFDALQLLKTQNIIDIVKADNQIITKKLIANPHILISLCEICFRPKSYSHPSIDKLNNDLTNKAIEILNNLSEEFSQFLMDSQSQQKADQDDVVTDQIKEKRVTNPVFLHCMKILEEEKFLDETPLAYFSRIVTSLCYQKPKQVIYCFSQTHCQPLINHLYSSSIQQILQRLMQIQDSSSFFEKQKLQIIKMYQNNITEQQNEEILIQKLDNYLNLMDNFSQKLGDRFDKAKYSSLARQILNRDQCVEFLVEKALIFSDSSEITEMVIKNLDRILGFDINNRSFGQSPTFNKLFDNNLSVSIQEIRISAQNIKQIQQFFIKELNRFLGETTKSTNVCNAAFYIISYLKLLKSIINVDRPFITKFSCLQFINKLLSLFKQLPHNNILHNIIKQIIINFINYEFKKTLEILFNEEECQFVNMALKITSKNSAVAFQNQLYHIFQAIIKKIQENEQMKHYSAQYQFLEPVLTTVSEKEKFYSEPAGGNARKESSCWGDSSSQIVFDRFVIPQKQDPVDTNQQHWFDCGLPLDSDSSRQQLSCNSNENKLSYLNSKSPRSPRGIESSNLLLLQNSKDELKMQDLGMDSGRKESEIQEEVFTQNFSSYLTYSVEQVLSELQ